MPKAPRLVIFDLDGTLVEYEVAHVIDQMVERLPGLGYPDLDRKEIEHYFASDNMFGFAASKDSACLQEIFWGAFDRGTHPELRTIEGAVESLEWLVSRGIRCAIATARSADTTAITRQLAHTGLLPHISFMATRESRELDWRNKVPLISLICEKMRIAPGQTLMVGDTPSDIRSARKASLAHAIGVLTGGIYSHVLENEGPHSILESIKELPDYIERISITALTVTKSPTTRHIDMLAGRE